MVGSMSQTAQHCFCNDAEQEIDTGEGQEGLGQPQKEREHAGLESATLLSVVPEK